MNFGKENVSVQSADLKVFLPKLKIQDQTHLLIGSSTNETEIRAKIVLTRPEYSKIRKKTTKQYSRARTMVSEFTSNSY